MNPQTRRVDDTSSLSNVSVLVTDGLDTGSESIISLSSFHLSNQIKQINNHPINNNQIESHYSQIYEALDILHEHDIIFMKPKCLIESKEQIQLQLNGLKETDNLMDLGLKPYERIKYRPFDFYNEIEPLSFKTIPEIYSSVDEIRKGLQRKAQVLHLGKSIGVPKAIEPSLIDDIKQENNKNKKINRIKKYKVINPLELPHFMLPKSTKITKSHSKKEKAKVEIKVEELLLSPIKVNSFRESSIISPKVKNRLVQLDIIDQQREDSWKKKEIRIEMSNKNRQEFQKSMALRRDNKKLRARLWLSIITQVNSIQLFKDIITSHRELLKQQDESFKSSRAALLIIRWWNRRRILRIIRQETNSRIKVILQRFFRFSYLQLRINRKHKSIELLKDFIRNSTLLNESVRKIFRFRDRVIMIQRHVRVFIRVRRARVRLLWLLYHKIKRKQLEHDYLISKHLRDVKYEKNIIYKTSSRKLYSHLIEESKRLVIENNIREIRQRITKVQLVQSQVNDLYDVAQSLQRLNKQVLVDEISIDNMNELEIKANNENKSTWYEKRIGSESRSLILQLEEIIKIQRKNHIAKYHNHHNTNEIPLIRNRNTIVNFRNLKQFLYDPNDHTQVEKVFEITRHMARFNGLQLFLLLTFEKTKELIEKIN